LTVLERRRRRPPTDITGYLRETPALLLLHRLPVAMLGVGPLGDIAYANPACAHMLGYVDAYAVTRRSLPDLMSGHLTLTPSDCLATLRTPGATVSWNHVENYLIRTIVSPPLFLRASDPLLLVSVNDVTEWLWENKPVAAQRRTNGHSP
jgi:PAS domain-containing protein